VLESPDRLTARAAVGQTRKSSIMITAADAACLIVEPLGIVLVIVLFLKLLPPFQNMDLLIAQVEKDS
jgi:hypothetical protein